MLLKEHHVLNAAILVFTVTLVSIFILNTQRPTFAQSSNTVTHYTFDEGSGTTVGDSTSNNNTLSLNGGALFSAGQSGTSLSLDGNNDYASRQDSQLSGNIPSKSGGGGEDFTIAAWINVDQLGSRAPIVTKQGNSTRGFVLRMNSDNTLNMELWKNNSNGSFISSDITLSANTWVHVGVTYDFITDGTSIMKLFMNGSQVGQTTNAVGPPTPNSIALEVGRTFWSASFSEYFDGQIDEVYIFDSVLSQSEIQTVMNDLSVPPVTPPPPTQECDNGSVEGTEVCDQNTISCTQLGFDNGTASCNSTCTGWNTTTCSNNTTPPPPPPPPSNGLTGTSINLGDLNIPNSRIPQWYAPVEAEAGYEAAKSWPEYDVTCRSDNDGCSAAAGTNKLPSSWGCGPLISDTSALNCMLSNAPDNTALYVPTGTYNINSQGSIVKISRSNIVLRGAGINNTEFVNFQTKRGGNFVHNCDANSFGTAVSICGGSSGNYVNWIGGYKAEDTVITLANVNGFRVGGWIYMRMTGTLACEHLDKKLNAGGQPDAFIHITKIVGVGTADGLQSNQIRLDRGLRLDYDARGCTGWQAKPYTPLENVGFESIRLHTANSILISDIKFPFIVIQHLSNSWIVDSEFSRTKSVWLIIKDSARVWIQGNNFHDTNPTIQFNTAGISPQRGTDIVIENNYCNNSRVCVYPRLGAEGLITSYNLMRTGTHFAERSFFNHGFYPRETLTEGNDVNANMVWGDTFWGRNGPRITFYRNRNVKETCDFGQDSMGFNLDGSGIAESTFDASIGDVNVATDFITHSIRGVQTNHSMTPNSGPYYLSSSGSGALPGGFAYNTEYWICNPGANNYQVGLDFECSQILDITSQGSGTHKMRTQFAADRTNIIGNTMGNYVMTAIQANPACPPPIKSVPLSTWGNNLWMEKNAWRETAYNFLLDLNGTFWIGDSNNRSCGEGPNDACPRTLTSVGTNVNTQSPIALWQTENYPTSLYRTEIPSWWCQETVSDGGTACDWDQSGIGAFGDDFNGTLCKLPAEIRVDIQEGRGGVCTPVGGGAPPLPPTGLTNLFLTPTIEGRASVVGNTFSLRIFSQGGTTALATFSITANSTGKLLIPSNTLTSGTYDLHLKSPGYLGRKFTSLSLTSNSTVTLSGTLRAGDLNNDNVINSLDWSVMNPKWLTNDAIADLNGDGIVNTIDFSFLSGNWFEMGE